MIEIIVVLCGISIWLIIFCGLIWLTYDGFFGTPGGSGIGFVPLLGLLGMIAATLTALSDPDKSRTCMEYHKETYTVGVLVGKAIVPQQREREVCDLYKESK